MNRISLPQVVARLQAHYGLPKPPPTDDPWHFILWENVAYLADDTRREKAMTLVKKRAGTRPEQILSASDDVLLEVARFGIMPELRIERLRECARIALEDFDGDLRAILEWPVPKARRALQKFPGIGAPGAEKILMCCHRHPALALESNGLRVLLRLGFGEETKSYSKTYRLVQEATQSELEEDYPRLIGAHQLLRRHGQEVCTNSRPCCADCPLLPDCPSGERLA